MCDLSNFKHPGGNSLIVDVKGIFLVLPRIITILFNQGREISRFIYGNHALETSNVKAYIHSSSTMKILNSQFVGNISYGDTNILVKKY